MVQYRLLFAGILLATQAVALLLIMFSACVGLLSAVWLGHNQYAQGWAVVTVVIEISLFLVLCVGKVVGIRAECNVRASDAQGESVSGVPNAMIHDMMPREHVNRQ